MLPKIHIISKIASNKSVEHLISYKKVNGRTHIPPLGDELGGSTDYHPSNVIMYRTGKVDSL